MTPTTSISRAAMLANPDGTAPIALVTDVWTTAMGAILQQRKQDVWKNLAFFSKKMNTANQKYSAYDRELLAIYEAEKHFRHMLEARHFVILTDHNPLTYAFSQRRDKCTPRQFNHLYSIAQSTTDIRHISGRDDLLADALSCVETICTSTYPEDLAEAQATDAELTAFLQGTTALRFEKIQIPVPDVGLHCDTATSRPRPTFPKPSDGKYETFCTDSATSVQGQMQTSCLSDTCGLVFRKTAAPGHKHASLASGLPTHRNRRPTSDIGRLQILPYGSRPLFTLASSYSPAGHYDGDSRPSPAIRMDISLRMHANHHHRPGMAVRIAAVPFPGEHLWYPSLPHDSFPSNRQRPR